MLFILFFFSEIFLSNGSLNCSLKQFVIPYRFDMAFREALSLKALCNKVISSREGGIRCAKPGTSHRPVTIHFLGTLLFSETIDFDQKWAIFAQKGQSRVRRRCFEAKNQLLFEMVHEGPNGPSRFPCCVISLVFVVELTSPSHRSQLSRAIN